MFSQWASDFIPAIKQEFIGSFSTMRAADTPSSRRILQRAPASEPDAGYLLIAMPNIPSIGHVHCHSLSIRAIHYGNSHGLGNHFIMQTLTSKVLPTLLVVGLAGWIGQSQIHAQSSAASTPGAATESSSTGASGGDNSTDTHNVYNTGGAGFDGVGHATS